MATQILSIHLSPLLSAAAASSSHPPHPPILESSPVSDEKLADNYCPYTKILIKVQMWCGNQNLCCYEINTLEDTQTLKTHRHESSLAPNLQLHKLPLQAIWRRLAVNGGASIAVTVAGGKRRERLLSFITEHREESLGWYWRRQSGFQQQLIIRKQVKK